MVSSLGNHKQNDVTVDPGVIIYFVYQKVNLRFCTVALTMEFFVLDGGKDFFSSLDYTLGKVTTSQTRN